MESGVRSSGALEVLEGELVSVYGMVAENAANSMDVIRAHREVLIFVKRMVEVDDVHGGKLARTLVWVGSFVRSMQGGKQICVLFTML